MPSKSKERSPNSLATKRYLSGREIEASGDYPFINSSLEKWRSDGVGPAYIKLSPRKIVYDRHVLDEWLAARTRTSTNEPAA